MQLVTVLIPAFNAERYLEEALLSVSKQTWPCLEIVVVDDGSTDTTPARLDAWCYREPRLRVLRQANAGVSAALNAGIAIARGEFIARMDADDVMLPHRIERQIAFLEANPQLGFCASQMQMMNGDGRVFGVYRPKPTSLEELDAQLEQQEPIVFTHPTVTYRTELVKCLGGYRPAFEPCEDMELFGRMILAGQPGLVVPEVLMRYRVHGSSISGSKIEQQVRTRDMVRRIFYAQRSGKELDAAGYQRAVDRLSARERRLHEARIRSEASRQLSVYQHAEGRRVVAWAHRCRAAAYPALCAVRSIAARVAPAR